MTTQNNVAQARRDGVLFGIPLGDLGWFQSLLMGLATGFAAFFLSTFLAIVGLLAYLMTTGKTPDFALTYRVIGLPVGLVVGLLALGYLGVQYAKKVSRKSKSA
jgi:cytochrome bd-type quinol oxidase subunit 1